MTREEYSIALIKMCEPKQGYHVAFSGGKDSQILLHLCEVTGVKYTGYFCRTSVDPPEIISFIKRDYPNVVILNPSISMYNLILKKNALPTGLMKFCCKYLKEYAGENEVVLTGIRSVESIKRALRPEIEFDHNKLRLLIHPIKKWSNRQIYNYIKKHKIKINELYSLGFNRIGCIGCPCATKNEIIKIFRRYPGHRIAYINTIKKLREKGLYLDFDNEEDVFEWWIGNMSKKAYMENKKQMIIDI